MTEVSIPRMLLVQEKLNQAARLAQRMDEIGANMAKLSPTLDMKAAALGQDIRVPPEAKEMIEEFARIEFELEKLFNIQPEELKGKN